MKKTEAKAEGHRVSTQPQDHLEGIPAPGSPSGTNEVTKTNDEGRCTSGDQIQQLDQIPQEIRDIVGEEDFSKDIWQLTERGITVHNGVEWVDPTDQFLRAKALISVANGSATLIPIKIHSYPAAMELKCEVVNSKVEVDVLVGEEIFDVSKAIAEAFSGMNFSGLVAELENNNRKFIVNGEERTMTEGELVDIALEQLDLLFKDENVHLSGFMALAPMTENGNNITAGFMPMRTIDGATLSFTYADELLEHNIEALIQIEMPTTGPDEVTKNNEANAEESRDFGDPMPVYYVDTKGNVKIHSIKTYGDWKTSPYIFALEEIQSKIENGTYRCLEDCFKCGWFVELDLEDQLQLQEIAGWYLYDKLMREFQG